ncbi:putative Nudix hydrolase NudL [Alteripontixanthobacter maritimus]|uniref:Putative Nudix hydrolase NudL n=1 Tax=Alteripontixanthobacter maritimus TaxID=2161824 RepID=A0A369QBG3_9SPHN|nr:CoA pyrophosphatase [Alteripontixanthobacter maritimus]RDC60547.1 putative Nudix hydrolase NudL [Alteripontixanthobacter maritimus]
MTDLFSRLQRIFDDGHGDIGQPRVASPDLLTDARFASGTPQPAAVLIAVTNRPQPGVILTRRPKDMRDHPGQVAFPGGKIDTGEDAVTAALREAREELAMETHHVDIIGATDRYVTGTGFEITPVLGVVPPDLPLVPNPGEVESWFEVPLALLLDEQNYERRETFWRGANRQYFELHYDSYRIWGVTAAIIINLTRRMRLTELIDG